MVDFAKWHDGKGKVIVVSRHGKSAAMLSIVLLKSALSSSLARREVGHKKKGYLFLT